MSASVRIGAGAGYWGDMVDPAVELIEQGGVEFACFDLLAELTVALLTRAKMRDPGKGTCPMSNPFCVRRCPLPAVTTSAS